MTNTSMIGTKVYVTDPDTLYVITGIRLLGGEVVADLLAWPFGRGNVENVHTYAVAGLTAAGDQSL